MRFGGFVSRVPSVKTGTTTDRIFESGYGPIVVGIVYLPGPGRAWSSS